MTLDLISVFDSYMSVFKYSSWFTGTLYLGLVFVLVYHCDESRYGTVKDLLYGVPLDMVSKSKAAIFGGSHLMVTSLFITILASNMAGILPYCFSVSSQIVFTFLLAFSFWFGMIVSSLVLGRGRGSMAGLVPFGTGTVGGIVFSWVEKFSILLRVFSLSFRLTVNMAVGQVVLAALGTLSLKYFGDDAVASILLFLVGCSFTVVEFAVGILQAYLFCLLVSVYSDDHCLV